jgi:hypothetical protein
LANGKAPPAFPTSEKRLLHVEGLNDARTLLADFFSILLDPWVHPFRTVLSQLLIVAPQVGMVVVELGQEVVQFCGIFCF